MVNRKNLALAQGEVSSSGVTASAPVPAAMIAPSQPSEYPDYFETACKRLDAFRRMCDAERSAKAKLACLTTRERQMLGKMADGLSRPEIARDLAMSMRAEETERGDLLRKLGVRTGAQAIRIYLAATIFD